MVKDKFFNKLKVNNNGKLSYCTRWSNDYEECLSSYPSGRSASTSYTLDGIVVNVAECNHVSPIMAAALGRGPRLHRTIIDDVTTVITSARVYDDGVALLEYSFTRISDGGSTSRLIDRKFSFITPTTMFAVTVNDNYDEVGDTFLRMFCSNRQHLAVMVDLNNVWTLVSKNDVRGYAAELQRFNELTGLDYGQATVTVNDVTVYRPIHGSDDPSISLDKYVYYDEDYGYVNAELTLLDADLNEVEVAPLDLVKLIDTAYRMIDGPRLLTNLNPADAEYADAEYAVFDETLHLLIDGNVYRLPNIVNVGKSTQPYDDFMTNANQKVTERKKMLSELTAG